MGGREDDVQPYPLLKCPRIWYLYCALRSNVDAVPIICGNTNGIQYPDRLLDPSKFVSYKKLVMGMGKFVQHVKHKFVKANLLKVKYFLKFHCLNVIQKFGKLQGKNLMRLQSNNILGGNKLNNFRLRLNILILVSNEICWIGTGRKCCPNLNYVRIYPYLLTVQYLYTAFFVARTYANSGNTWFHRTGSKHGHRLWSPNYIYIASVLEFYKAYYAPTR